MKSIIRTLVYPFLVLSYLRFRYEWNEVNNSNKLDIRCTLMSRLFASVIFVVCICHMYVCVNVCSICKENTAKHYT